MNGVLMAPSKEAVSAENKIAMALSIFAPGLGQVYKGHVAEGLIWLFIGMPIAVWVGILLSLATAGVGLIVPIACWAGLVVDAYWEKDRRQTHHWFMGSGVSEDYSASVD
jgi:TM2 domain-containing membrane protein YozV